MYKKKYRVHNLLELWPLLKKTNQNPYLLFLFITWYGDSRIYKNDLLTIPFKFVVHIFTLLLAPFASELINYPRHSESLNIRKNSDIDDIFLRSQ